MNDLTHYQQNPDLFVTQVLGENKTIADVLAGRADGATVPTDKQIEIMNSVRDNKYTAVPSSNNSGKSHIASRIALWFCLTHVPSLVIITAPKQTQVRDIIFSYIKEAFYKAPVPLGGEMQVESYFPNRDLMPGHFIRGMTANTAEAFSGWHNQHLLIIVDEATGVDPTIWSGIEGIMSGEKCRILEISNPTTKVCDFYQHCQSPLYNTIHLDALHHPNVTLQREVYRGAVSPSWPKEMEDKWGTDHAMYQVRVRGTFPDDADNAVIPLTWIQSAVDRFVEHAPHQALGVDVARQGDAETAVVKRTGRTFTLEFTEGKSDLVLLRDRIEGLGIQVIGVDDVGLGGGLVDMLNASGAYVVPFTANANSDAEENRLRQENWHQQARRGAVEQYVHKTTDHEKRSTTGRFKDLQSEAWWDLRTLFEETYRNPKDPYKGISIPNDQELIYQLSARHYETDNDTIRVLPKKDLEYATDRADAMVICNRTYRRTYRHMTQYTAPRARTVIASF